VDARGSAAFSRAFLAGTVCVPGSKAFTGYFGSIAPEDTPVALLVASAADAARLAQRLHLIGFDRVLGFAVADEAIAARRTAGQPVASLAAADLADVRRRLAGPRSPRLVDVRSAAERMHGTIPGALGVPLGDLREWAARAPPANGTALPVVVHCQTGTRAVIGASVLVAAGFSDVTPMAGGFDAWTAAGLPVSTPAR
jgi:hydroxyacylglutathione hydrolase